MIEIKNLQAGYGNEPILKNMNASFEEGKLHVIIGKNGSGKSTLLKAILQQLPQCSPSIYLDGTLISSMSPEQRAQQMAYVMQNKAIPQMKALQLVMHGRFCHLKWPRRYGTKEKQMAFEAMKKLHVEDLANRSVNSLSGGQQQKAYLALALCQDTKTILMDEPSAFLDPASILELMEQAKAMSREKKTVIMVLHDLTTALEYADVISVIDEGQMLFQGTVQDLLKSGLLEKIFHIKAVPANIQGQDKYVLLKEETKSPQDHILI